MHPKYPNVFSPIRIGPVEISNRFYISPHAGPYPTAQGGPSAAAHKYFSARMKDGCGLSILSLIIPERTKGIQPRPHAKENVPAFRALADRIHADGGKVFGELWYWWGRAGPWAPLSPSAPSFGVSNVQGANFEKTFTTREMTRSDIGRMIEAFRQSAENLRDAGFDGIEIHASHGALVEQFLSPYFNRRTDEYGGSLENRMRFLVEILQAVRQTVGDKMAVGVRLNCDELLTEGYDTEGAREFVRRLAAAGLADFFDLDVAIEPIQFHLGMPPVMVEPHVYRPYVEAVRGAAGDIPVLSVLGRTTSIAQAEAAIAAGVCDMVGAARALIAEPDLVKNAYEGNEELSRTCIACNACMAALPEAAQSCAINPSTWNELAWGEGSWTPAPHKSKVLVIGSGPAGLEAARVAAIRGHDVELIEARDALGGALSLWAELPGREFYMKAVEWWEREIRRLGVRVRLGETATVAGILAAQPDAVILATGARYSEVGRSLHRDQPITGYDRDFVYRPEQILLGQVSPKGRIVVLDGEGAHTGVGVAQMLALAGNEVELLTPNFSPVSQRVVSQNELVPMIQSLRTSGVKVTPATYIRRIDERSLTVYDVYSQEERTIEGVDAVILSTGRVSVNDLEMELDGRLPQVFAVGDAAGVRMFTAAAYEGQKFARLIGEPGAPRSIGELYFAVD